MIARGRATGRRGRQPELLAASAAVVLIVAVFYAAFGPGNPFAGRFEVKAEVPTASGLRVGSPVRVNGLDVGTVAAIRRGREGTALVVLRLDHHDGLHADAAVRVRPRLLLEGNDYVELFPGRPSAPPLTDGARIASTSAAVQLDQVLSTLTAATRNSLRSSVGALAAMLGPRAPRARRSGGADLRRASRDLARTLPSFARVAVAARGTVAGDLPELVTDAARASRQAAAQPARLKALVDHYATVVEVLDRRDRDLQATLGALVTTLQDAPERLQAIDTALPHLDRYASLLRPALRAAPGALRPTARALRELRNVAAAGRLPLLLRRLRPFSHNLRLVVQEAGRAAPWLERAGRCVSRNVVPTLNKPVPDGRLSTGRPAWQDLLHMAAALTGTSPGFDGNGGTLRISLAEGANTVRGLLPGIGPVVSSANLEGVSPQWLGPGKVPQFRPDAPCVKQELPDLAKRRAPGLPRGLRRIAPTPLTASQAIRKRAIVRGLTGSAADRRALYRLLLSDVRHSTVKRRPPTSRRPQPVRMPPATPAQSEHAGSSTPSTLPPPPESGGVLERVGRLVGDALGRLLPGGSR